MKFKLKQVETTRSWVGRCLKWRSSHALGGEVVGMVHPQKRRKASFYDSATHGIDISQQATGLLRVQALGWYSRVKTSAAPLSTVREVQMLTTCASHHVDACDGTSFPWPESEVFNKNSFLATKGPKPSSDCSQTN